MSVGAPRSSPTPEQQTRTDAVRLSTLNPEAAIAQAQQLPEDQRASTMLDIARNFSGDYPERAAELIAAIQRGCELANRVILEQQRTGDIHFFTGLGPLVQVGVDNDPDVTIPFIESLSPSYVKAQLLLIAGSDLSMGTRVPLRFHPQQKVEKPAQ